MSKKSCFLISLALISVMATSCRKGNTGPFWDVDVLAPLLRTTLSLDNILADSLLSVAPDSALYLAYNGTVFRLTLDTLVQIPDETIQQTFILPFGTIYLQPGEAIPTLGNSQKETKYNLNGVELKQVKILSGSITFELSSSIQEAVELSYQMQDAVKAGVPFSISETVPAGTQAQQSTIVRSYDLSGYTIDMTGINLNDVNTIVAQFAAVISPAATDSVAVSQGDKFDIKYTFNSIKTAYAAGYFGNYSISDSFTDSINIFKKIPKGYLNLDSVGLDITISNGFGIDAQLRIDTLRSFNTGTGASADLNHAVVGNAVNLTRALNIATWNTPFTYSEYIVSMNTNNSNVDELVEALPDRFKYAFTMDINPLGNNSYGNDFFYYESDVKIGIDVLIPARFSADGLTILDTLDFDLGHAPDAEHQTTVTGGFFYLYADNGFPFDAVLQLYLYDENFTLIDSLVHAPGNVMKAAPVDLNFKVSSIRQSRLDIPVDDERMAVFERARKAIVIAVFTTQPGNQVATIYNHYKVDLKLIGDFTYRAKVK